MPFGSSMVLPYIVEQLYPTPKTVMDIGIGYGMNGALVRQYSSAGHELDNPPEQFLLGLEPFAKYRTPLWEVYDKVRPDTLQECLDRAPVYSAPKQHGWDLILMTDVIEHLEKPDGIERLKQLQRRLNAGGKLLVSTPAIWIEQGAAHGNEHERHKSLWDCDDFRRLEFDILWDGTPQRGQQMIVAVYKNGEVE